MKPKIELWKSILGFEGYYEASSLGRIRAVDRMVWNPHINKFRFAKGKILKATITTNGYPAVGLYRNRIRTQKPVHMLILLAFKGPPPPGCIVRHKNGIKTHLQLSNLEYGTYRQNAADSRKHHEGKHPYTKLTLDQYKEIRKLKGSLSRHEIALKFGVHPNTIWHIQTKGWVGVADNA